MKEFIPICFINFALLEHGNRIDIGRCPTTPWTTVDVIKPHSCRRVPSWASGYPWTRRRSGRRTLHLSGFSTRSPSRSPSIFSGEPPESSKRRRKSTFGAYHRPGANLRSRVTTLLWNRFSYVNFLERISSCRIFLQLCREDARIDSQSLEIGFEWLERVEMMEWCLLSELVPLYRETH